jgi:hydrogenase expression/formation protein HypD
MDVRKIIDYLKNYDGRPLKLMEVCGTHTAAIFKNGIRDLISPKIRLISGPGCPVCVTPTAYIDACTAFAKGSGHELLTFGDMMKVPGENGSLSENRTQANVSVMYSPFEAIELAKIYGGDDSPSFVNGVLGQVSRIHKKAAEYAAEKAALNTDSGDVSEEQ